MNKSNIIKSVNIYSAASKSSSVKSTSKCIKLVIINQYKSVYINTKDVIVFVIIYMKTHYNKAHQFCFFDIDNIINLWLHCSYSLFSIQNKKLEQQFVDFLYIIEWIKRLVYHLNIFAFWQIHDVVSIVHLELVSQSEDDFY